MKKTPTCKKTGNHDYVIKDNIKFCMACGEIEDYIPPMCEIVGVCEWVTYNNITFCPHCGKEKPEISKAESIESQELTNG